MSSWANWELALAAGLCSTQAQCHDHAGARLRLPPLARAAAFRPGNPPRPRAATARRAEAAPGPAPPLGRRPRRAARPAGGGLGAGLRALDQLAAAHEFVQDATRGLKDKVVDALRRPEAEAELATIGRDLNLLVTSGNTGVTERARSTLLTQQRAWEELLPVRAAFPRYARDGRGQGRRPGGAAAGRALRRRRARRLRARDAAPGPVPERGQRRDAAAEDAATLRLTPRFGGGWFVRCLGVPLPLPRLGAAAPREVVVLYLEGDVLVAVDRRGGGDAPRLRGAAARGFRSPFGLRAKLAALRVRSGASARGAARASAPRRNPRARRSSATSPGTRPRAPSTSTRRACSAPTRTRGAAYAATATRRAPRTRSSTSTASAAAFSSFFCSTAASIAGICGAPARSRQTPRVSGLAGRTTPRPHGRRAHGNSRPELAARAPRP